MTVEQSNPIITFVADGVTTIFTLTFEVESKDNLKVTANRINRF
ncbi:hypothetical protein R7J20_16735 [Acinetobacter baumannii]|nr:hypothetical protein [Acinetobacter baumannii]MDW5349541.1 hypothetical protein [Acinetobacter baumannii]MDW5367033.1 hypothetical protein [Acinetobacter baumannii]MDW5382302.1 hypothetical protein [Acinetobacter baumannii]